MKTWGLEMLITDLLRRLGRGLFLVAVGALTLIHSPVEAADAPGGYDPLADPRAVVTTAHARFTILTPQLIRMEWAADGKFEDHASLVFLNRKLPVPKIDVGYSSLGSITMHWINTSALSLGYATHYGTDEKFSTENLSIRMHLDGKEIVRKPGTPDTGNLLGT